MDREFEETIKFNTQKDKENIPKDIMFSVYESLQEKGYDPINQLIGYILSGDPTYITSYKEARSLICKIERDELLEELINFYLENKK